MRGVPSQDHKAGFVSVSYAARSGRARSREGKGVTRGRERRAAPWGPSRARGSRLLVVFASRFVKSNLEDIRTDEVTRRPACRTRRQEAVATGSRRARRAKGAMGNDEAAEIIIERALAKAREREKLQSERPGQGPTLSQLRWRKSILHCRVASAFALAGERARSRRLCHAWRVAVYRVLAVNHFLRIMQTKRGARHRWRRAFTTLIAVHRFSKGSNNKHKFHAELKRCSLRTWSTQTGEEATSMAEPTPLEKLSVVTSRLQASKAPHAREHRSRKIRGLATSSRRKQDAKTMMKSNVTVNTDGDQDDMTDSEESLAQEDLEVFDSRDGDKDIAQATKNDFATSSSLIRRTTGGSESESDGEEAVYHLDNMSELLSMNEEHFERTWRALSFHSPQESALAQAASSDARSLADDRQSPQSAPGLKDGAAAANSLTTGSIAAAPDTVSRITSAMLHAKTRAEDFEPLRIVGTGGSGQVYLVQHRQTCKRFAMKVLNKAEVIASNKFERVITEREILTRASSQESSFLTRLNFAFHSDNMLFFVMEYCSGGNLHEAMLREHEIRKPTMDKERYRLAMDAAAEGQGLIGSLAFIRYFDRANLRRRGPRDILLRFGLAPVHVQFIMAEIIEGLMFLHSAGFVYRDLKPQNVMLHGDGHIRIGDFGISKAGQNKGNAVVKLRSTSFVGTVEYMAPEVVSGDQQSNAVDLWGLGVLLYELLLGAPPFWALGVGASVPTEAEQRQLFAAILSPETHLDFPLSGQISIVAQDLVKRWMRRRPGERLGLEAAKKHAFFNGLNWRSLKNSSGFHKLMPRLHIHRKDRKAVSLARSTSNNIFVANALSAGDIFSESLVQDGEQGRRKSLGSLRKNSSSGLGTSDRSLQGHRRSFSGRLNLARGRSQGAISAPVSPQRSESGAILGGATELEYELEGSAAAAPLSMLPSLDVHVSAPRSQVASSVASDVSSNSSVSSTTLASATSVASGANWDGAASPWPMFRDEPRSRSSSAATAAETTSSYLNMERPASKSKWIRMRGWMRSISGNKTTVLERAASEPVEQEPAPRFFGHTHSDDDKEKAAKVRASGFHSGHTSEARDGAGFAATDTNSSESKMPGAKDGHLVHVSAQDSFQGFDWKADGS